MATQSNSTAKTDRARLSEAGLEGCYLETLLTVIEDAFEEIDGFCRDLPAELAYTGWIRAKAQLGLNVAYMAQDKAGAIKRLTDAVEKDLCRAEIQRRNEAQGAVQ